MFKMIRIVLTTVKRKSLFSINTISKFKNNWSFIFLNTGVAFQLGRLITNSRNSAFTGSFWNHFLKKTSQGDGRTKNWIMKRLLH